MMAGHIFGGLTLIFLGIFTVIARLSRWKWFNEHYKVIAVEDTFGEKTTDVFYMVLGILLIVFGILIMTRLVG